jgi:YtcA-like protein
MHCPSLNIFGTFFPSWMLCVIAGVVVAVLAHKVLAAVGLGAEVKPPLLVYPSLGLAAAFLVWLVRYGS